DTFTSLNKRYPSDHPGCKITSRRDRDSDAGRPTPDRARSAQVVTEPGRDRVRDPEQPLGGPVEQVADQVPLEAGDPDGAGRATLGVEERRRDTGDVGPFLLDLDRVAALADLGELG